MKHEGHASEYTLETSNKIVVPIVFILNIQLLTLLILNFITFSAVIYWDFSVNYNW